MSAYSQLPHSHSADEIAQGQAVMSPRPRAPQHNHLPPRPRSESNISSSPSPPPSPRTHSTFEKKRQFSRSAGRSGRLRAELHYQYAGSASSHGGREQDTDGFVFTKAEDTEVERLRHRHERESSDARDAQRERARSATPIQRRIRPDVAAHPLAVKVTLLPRTTGLGAFKFTVNRKRCEDTLLLTALFVAIAQLGYGWQEWALAAELSFLFVISVVYVRLRSSPALVPIVVPRPKSPGLVQMRNRSRRSSQQGGAIPRLPDEDDLPPGIGSMGCIWGTEEREYRECLDDGALFALLLSPLTAAAMLHGALIRLASEPETATLPGWVIEAPLVIPSTPIRWISSTVPHNATDAIRALSALAIARRNLVQLFTLCSFVLLVQMTWSLRNELRIARGIVSPGNSPPMSTVPLDSDQERELVKCLSTYWLRRGELRRNLSVIGFAFFVTGCCVIVKIVTAYFNRGVWSDMSHSDVVIATLFYQFCLYVCVRLARRGFTLGELGLVTHAATALFMEVLNMTRTKIPIFRTPYIKTYRLPTPLLIFQLALIPGSLLTGFLLSPLLYISRSLAQRPLHRLRFPEEKTMHRRLLATGFYAGTLLVVIGVVGSWTYWCLGKRDPWIWVIRFLVSGKHAWTRPALLAYWISLALIAVGLWQRQLSRARRHKPYVVPHVHRDSGSSTTSPLSHSTSHTNSHPSASRVAAQMMDAADQKLPTLSVNARRKSFHALAVAMFVPGLAFDPAFTHLSFSVAFAAFTFAEYIRYFALWPLGASVHLFLNEFIDHKDSGTAILSHFYLLAGCACPLWFEGPSELLSYFGILSLGIGDAAASIIGRRIGYARWSSASGKTVEGSIAFAASVTAAAVAMWSVGAIGPFRYISFMVTTVLTTLLEAFSAQNDNLVLPVYGWAVGTLLGV